MQRARRALGGLATANPRRVFRLFTGGGERRTDRRRTNDSAAEWWFPLIPGVYRNSGKRRAGCGGWVLPPVMGGTKAAARRDNHAHAGYEMHITAHEQISNKYKQVITVDELEHTSRRTRHCGPDTFIILQSRVDAYKFSFFPRTVSDWNSLPSSARSTPSVNSFKTVPHRLSGITNSHHGAMPLQQ